MWRSARCFEIDKIVKPWKEAAALNGHINLYGFWDEATFLTKTGDLGMVLSVPGVDYESLDRAAQDYGVKRLEAALKAFEPGFHVYQYLFKSNRLRFRGQNLVACLEQQSMACGIANLLLCGTGTSYWARVEGT